MLLAQLLTLIGCGNCILSRVLFGLREIGSLCLILGEINRGRYRGRGFEDLLLDIVHYLLAARTIAKGACTCRRLDLTTKNPKEMNLFLVVKVRVGVPWRGRGFPLGKTLLAKRAAEFSWLASASRAIATCQVPCCA
jgi:hypothetical protein